MNKEFNELCLAVDNLYETFLNDLDEYFKSLFVETDLGPDHLSFLGAFACLALSIELTKTYIHLKKRSK